MEKDEVPTALRPLGGPQLLSELPNAEVAQHHRIIALDSGFAVTWNTYTICAQRIPSPDLVVQVFDADGQPLTESVSVIGDTDITATPHVAWANDRGGLSFVMERRAQDTDAFGGSVGLIRVDTDAAGSEIARNDLSLPDGMEDFTLRDVLPQPDGTLLLDLEAGTGRALYRHDAGTSTLLEGSSTTNLDPNDNIQTFALEDGALLIVRTDNSTDMAARETVTFQRIGADGVAADPAPIDVAGFVGAASSAIVTRTEEGTFRLVWRAHTPDANVTNTVFSQRFNADGTALEEPQILASNSDADPISTVSVAERVGGDIALVWQADLRDVYGDIPICGGYPAFLQQIHDGVATGPLQPVHDVGGGRDENYEITTLSDGDVIVSWEIYIQGGSNPSGWWPGGREVAFHRFNAFDDLSGTDAADRLTSHDADALITGRDGDDRRIGQ